MLLARLLPLPLLPGFPFAGPVSACPFSVVVSVRESRPPEVLLLLTEM